ncbi:MAG: hypothetical protein M3N30_06440 [Bacteroidota bacterium]|nr:hypothetical protein [Bacteroidota bacterium]
MFLRNWQFLKPPIYYPSFFLEFEYFGKLIKAEVKPMESDKGYYTINLNGNFFAHIHKGENWTDAIGRTGEMFQIVGKLIEEHVK